MRTADNNILKRLQQNLIGNSYTAEEEKEMADDIICAFEDAEYDGETYVQISEDEFLDGKWRVQAYIDHLDASIFSIWFNKDEENNTTIIDITM